MIDFQYLVHRMNIYDFDVHHKTVLVRVDFNVPISEDRMAVLDDTRIRESLPTIRYLLERQAKVILVSHFKRPKGPEANKSLNVVLPRLEELVGQRVHFLQESVKSDILHEEVQRIGYGEVILLENIRFYPEETLNDEEFAGRLARLCDVFLNDAFGTMHRAHASTVGITKFVPSGLGLLPMKEIQYIEKLVLKSEHPLTVILGGGKVSSKIGVLEGLLAYADHILIGGGMVFTFWQALGYNIGNSFFEPEVLERARDLLSNPKYKDRIVLPVDVVVAKKIQEGIDTRVVGMKEGIPEDEMGLDIGPQTRELFHEILLQSRTIFWNGPVGVFEVPPFDAGTKAMALSLAEAAKKPGVLTLVGGGESAMAAKLYGVDKVLSHISTGGGALLELLEGKPLPGIVAISKK